MSKKNNDKETFNLTESLNDLPEADFLKRAFVKTVDVSKIKSKNDLEKEFKKYKEMK